MLPIVRLRRPDSERPGEGGSRFSNLPVRTKEALICEAVTLPPERQLPYEFELRAYEGVQFIFRSEFPLDVLFGRMPDYEDWVRSGCQPAQPLLVYSEAFDTVGHAIQFVAPEDGCYTAILSNQNCTTVDVAVEIRLSPPIPGRAHEL